MFNLRVYGVLLNENRQVLVADEFIRGGYYTKFPGGGMEPGEGTRECLEREFMEEMQLKVKTGEHIYTTDYYQVSAFNPSQQLIAIYYYVHALEPITVALRDKEFDFDEQQLSVYKNSGETETFRFINWDDFSEEKVTLPIDKIVAGLIKSRP